MQYLKKSKEEAPLQFLKIKLKNGFHMVAFVGFVKYVGLVVVIQLTC